MDGIAVNSIFEGWLVVVSVRGCLLKGYRLADMLSNDDDDYDQKKHFGVLRHAQEH